MKNDAEVEALAHAEKVAEEAYRNARAAREKAERRGREERAQALRPIAERAHNLLCQWNHTDGCSWGYEERAEDPWSCDAHYQWLERYDKLIHGAPATGYSRAEAPVPVEDVIAVLDLVEQLSPSEKRVFALLRAGKLGR